MIKYYHERNGVIAVYEADTHGERRVGTIHHFHDGSSHGEGSGYYYQPRGTGDGLNDFSGEIMATIDSVKASLEAA